MNLDLLLPGALLALYTIVFFGYLGFRRLQAVKEEEIGVAFFRTYDDGTQPEKLQVLSRHAINLLETPVLYYLALVFLTVADRVSIITLSLAYGYLITRWIHAWIHLGSNRVNRRFTAFTASMLLLTGLWIDLTIQLVSLQSWLN